MRNTILALSTEMAFVIEECCACGAAFAMTESFQAKRVDDKRSFYCPSGHGQSYTGEPLRDQLSAAQRALANAQEENRIAAAEINRMKSDQRRIQNRLKAGVCPHCHRTFAQLSRHMASKHSEEE